MFKLEFTQPELKVLGAALSQMPYCQVAELIAKVSESVNSQAKDMPESKGKEE